MPQINISGPGVGLPYPQNLYPTDLFNAPVDSPTNYLTLEGGQMVVIPAGEWWVDPGALGVLEYLDPVTGVWRGFQGVRGQPQVVHSDGFTRRVANLTGCPVAAVVAAGGSGFAQSTATITANVGGSTWQAIVGGSLSVSSVVATGSGFTIPPMVFIPAPPTPGVQATAHAAIANGTVSSVTLDDVGAGYTAATVSAVILPSPADLATGIVNGQVNFTLTNSGKITAALCTNNGAPLATISALTLTAAGGAGSGATITPVVMQTVTATSVVAGGAGWGTASAFAKIMSATGIPSSVSGIGNASIELTGYRPRSFDGAGVTNAGGTIASINTYDSGLFVGTATPAVAPGGGSLPTTAASITFTMGTGNTVVLLQPL